jgi:beta-lactamase class A
VTLWLTLGIKQNDSFTNQYPLVDIARNFIPQEHFIVNIQPLREQLEKLVSSQESNTVSIYFEFLNTGANIQLNNDERFYPASLVKIPTALAAMRKIEDGTWNMSSRLVLFEQDRDSRFGDLYKQPVGTSFSIEELLKKLLIESDNTAHKILMRNLSGTDLDKLRDAIGLNDLFNEKSEVSAKEYSRLFRALYNSSYLSRSGSEQLLEWLSQTNFNETLGSGLPEGTKFSHKIGEDDVEDNYLDSGIVYLPNRPFLITVMVKKHSKQNAHEIMQQVAKVTRDYINGYK